jgi:hypothetical protein
VRHLRLAALALATSGLSGCTTLAQIAAAAAAAAPPPTAETIAPGITHRRVTIPSGPFVLNLVTIDLRNRGYELRHVRARDSLAGRERLTAMVARQRANVVVAINADFFSLQTGENENNVLIDGEWWKGTHGTVSPFDSYDNIHTQFGVSETGRPLLDRFAFLGTAIHKGAAFPITAVNYFQRTGNEATVLYTPRYGETPGDTTRLRQEVVLRRIGQRGDTVVYVQQGAPMPRGRNLPPRDGAILSAYGPRSITVGRFASGDTVFAILAAAGDRGDGPPIQPRLLIGGWPRILSGGRNVAARAPWAEGTISSNAEARHPRSAIGFNHDSTMLYIATVDGRQQASVGMTLVEFADFLRQQGVWDALNFDGGGSTTLVVNGRVVNRVSETTGEREIANALMVVRRQP